MMKPVLFLLALVVSASCLLAAPQKKGVTPPEGFRALFDGKSLEGWFTVPENRQQIWKVDEEGSLSRDLDGPYIWTVGLYSDFILDLEFKLSWNCNSGIFFRTDPGDPVQGGFEIQILDTPQGEAPGKHDIGALYDAQAASSNPLKKRGEWNHLRLHVEGSLVKVWINETLVNDIDLSQWTTPEKNPDGTKNKFKTALSELPGIGHIGFQDHGHNVWYRNIFIKEL